MRLIPAIYIQNGRVVSLYKGKENQQKKTYAKSAKTYASLFQKQGAKTLFIVDLDGDQKNKLYEIRKVFHGELWWAGKLRSLEGIGEVIKRGADRVVLGRSAKDIYESALSKYGSDRLILGLKVQHRDEGPDLCEQYANSGFKDILIKDINAEGTLFLPSFDLYEKCVYFSGLSVYSSGGVSDLKHLQLLEKSGVKGAVVSRALFENELSLAKALSLYPS